MIRQIALLLCIVVLFWGSSCTTSAPVSEGSNQEPVHEPNIHTENITSEGDANEPALTDAGEPAPEVTPEPLPEPSASRCPRGQVKASGDAPCAPAQALKWKEREITFSNGKQKLYGTLTTPALTFPQPLPAVILVHGSGPNDRDESHTASLGVNYGKTIKPFRDLAHALAKRGYIVLRYDKRSFRPKELVDPDKIRVDDFTNDANAGLDWLKQQKEVDPKALIAIGHSQGGSLVIDLATLRDDLVKVVSLAGGATSLKSLLLDQYDWILEQLKKLPPSPQTNQQITQTKETRAKYEKALDQIEQGTFQGKSFEGAPLSFWKSWIDNHARIESQLKKIKVPFAAVSGTLDFNVPPKHTELLSQWRAGFKGDWYKLYDKITHGFIKVEGNTVPDAIDPTFTTELINWLNQP